MNRVFIDVHPKLRATKGYVARNVLIVLIGAALFAASGCKKDDPKDETPPVIEISKPVENALYLITDFIEFSGRFSDDKELDRVEISLVYLGQVSPTAGRLKDTGAWEPQQVIALTGAAQNFQDFKLFNMAIPDRTYGYFKLRFELFDKAGNTSVKEVIISIS